MIICLFSQGLEICFYDTDGVSLLDDYCFTTYTTYNEGHACAPAENAAYKTLYESFMFSPQYLMRRAAGDLFLVITTAVYSSLLMVHLDLRYYLHWFCYPLACWAFVFAATYDHR